uniref:Uncharacterized protein n=1 Tax=Mimivirus LCMiAC01 TaxID=2506608 RepID=A0A481Z0G8_9VIRU|nr:MAG: hypothetical protein LCMiAC01_02340 [Mimivirus LCMiAC01]
MDSLSIQSENIEAYTYYDEPLLNNNKKKLNILSIIKFIKFCWTEFNNNSDLLSALLILIIDIVFFVGKWFPKFIPVLITEFSYTALCFLGLLSYPFQFIALIKKIGDIHMSIKYKNCYIATWNIFLVIIRIESIISILVYFVVGCCLIFKYNAIPDVVFKISIPIGFISIFTSLGKDILTFILNIWIAKKIKYIEIENDHQKLKLKIIYKLYTDKYYHNNVTCYNTVNLGLWIRSNMDVGTWRKLSKELIKRSEEEFIIMDDNLIFLKENLLKNIKIQRNMACIGIVLNIMGDISMGLCKMFPYSKLQATIDLVMAVLYDIRLLIKKSLQCMQRCGM